MKIGMVSIFVNNPLEAFHFYTEKLGFIEKMFMPEAFVAIVAAPADPNGTQVLLEPSDNPIAKTYQTQLYGANLPCIVFSVEDIEKEYVKMKGKGIVFRKPPKRTEWGMEAVFEDTCGNLIQLYQA